MHPCTDERQLMNGADTLINPDSAAKVTAARTIAYEEMPHRILEQRVQVELAKKAERGRSKADAEDLRRECRIRVGGRKANVSH